MFKLIFYICSLWLDGIDTAASRSVTAYLELGFTRDSSSAPLLVLARS